MPADLLSGESPLSGLRTVVFPSCLFTGEGLRSSLELCSLKIRTLIQFMKISEGRDPLITQSPPNTIALRVGFQPRNLGQEDTNTRSIRTRRTETTHTSVRGTRKTRSVRADPRERDSAVRRNSARVRASSQRIHSTRNQAGLRTPCRVPCIRRLRTGAAEPRRAERSRSIGQEGDPDKPSG